MDNKDELVRAAYDAFAKKAVELGLVDDGEIADCYDAPAEVLECWSSAVNAVLALCL